MKSTRSPIYPLASVVVRDLVTLFFGKPFLPSGTSFFTFRLRGLGLLGRIALDDSDSELDLNAYLRTTSRGNDGSKPPELKKRSVASSSTSIGVVAEEDKYKSRRHQLNNSGGGSSKTGRITELFSSSRPQRR